MAKSLSSFLNTTGELRKNLRFEAGNEFEQTIKDWIEERTLEAERVLKENKNYSTGALAKSIEPRPFKKEDNNLVVEIMANNYWKFVNYGVNGVFKSQNSRYSFRNLGVGREMKRNFGDFIRNRGIQSLTYTNKKGESVVKQLSTAKDFESASYVLAKSVKKKGIEGNEFMDIAFGRDALIELSRRLEQNVVSIFST